MGSAPFAKSIYVSDLCAQSLTVAITKRAAMKTNTDARSTVRIRVCRHIRDLTMKLIDAGLHCRPTKLIYPDHRLTPWSIEDAACDRWSRLLGVPSRSCLINVHHPRHRPRARHHHCPHRGHHGDHQSPPTQDRFQGAMRHLRSRTQARLVVGTSAPPDRDDDDRSDTGDNPSEYQLEHLLQRSLKIRTSKHYCRDEVQQNHQGEGNRSYRGGHTHGS